jgi:hypothetical protein
MFTIKCKYTDNLQQCINHSSCPDDLLYKDYDYCDAICKFNTNNINFVYVGDCEQIEIYTNGTEFDLRVCLYNTIHNNKLCGYNNGICDTCRYQYLNIKI